MKVCYSLVNAVNIGARLPHSMASHSLVTTENNLYTIGGFDGYNAVSDILKFECETSDCSWTPMDQKLRFGRFDAVAILIPDDVTECTNERKPKAVEFTDWPMRKIRQFYWKMLH